MCEIKSSIEELGSEISPGPDRLSAKLLHKAVKCVLSQALHCVIKEVCESKQLPITSRAAQVVVTQETEYPAELLLVGSHQPVSLTIVDYNIFMKILASRLQSVTKALVGPRQRCRIKSPTICTNVHVARGIVECWDAFTGRVAMLQVDVAKDFERMGHKILMVVSLSEYLKRYSK